MRPEPTLRRARGTATGASALAPLILAPLAPVVLAPLAPVALAPLVPVTLAAQQVTLGGQIRPRYEFRDPEADGDKDAFTTMRVRASLHAVVDTGLTAYVEIQDVRTFGEERSTLSDFSADNLDVHQAYLRYIPREVPWLTATAGRQETSFGGERLVGAVGWTQQARSFDGLRIDAGGARGRLSLVAYQLADASAPTQASDAELFGAYGTLRNLGPGLLDAFWLFDRDEADDDTEQHTFGARYVFARGGFSGRVEGALQRGDRSGASVSASMFGARLRRSLLGGRAGFTVWYDRLSGDDDAADGDVEVFSTLFATNHKFYGLADLFLDLPRQTAGRGLEDLAFKIDGALSERTTLGVDFHRFSAEAGRGLRSDHLGDELDLTLAHRLAPRFTVTAGFSFVFQDDGLREIGRLSEEMTWTYVMLDVTF